MKRALHLAVSMVCASAACGVDLGTPDALVVTCSTNADCLDGKVCAPLIGTCVAAIDDQAPSIAGIDATSADGLRVVFSEPVACSAAGDVSSYIVAPPLSVALASGTTCTSVDGFTTDVVLFTEPQTPSAPYVLTASAITDQGGNPLAADGASKPFMGFGDAPDPSPPDALAPADRARLLGAQQSLVWTTRPGATSYLVEVATDPAFASLIAGAPFTVTAPATSLLITGLADVTHYWRVRSDLTPDAVTLAVHDFDVLVDTVYVSCSGATPCNDSITRNGSRTRPYASVQKALAAAAELSTALRVPTPTVKVAARDAGAAYVGAVVVQWQSVNLLGGFDATFSTRTTDADATVIEAPGDALIVSNLPVPTPTLIEGLTFHATLEGFSAIRVSAASSALTMRNVAGHAEGAPVGVLSVSGGPAVGARYEGCRFTTGAPATIEPAIVNLRNAAGTFVDTQVVFLPGTYQAARVFDVSGPLPGDLVIDGGTFAAPDVGDGSRVFSLEYPAQSGGRVVVRNVTASTRTGSSTHVMELHGSVDAVIENSHFAMGARAFGAQSATISAYDSLQAFSVTLAIRNSIIESQLCGASQCVPVRMTRATRFEITNSLILTHDDLGAPLILGDTNPIITNSVLASGTNTLPCITTDGGFTGCTAPVAMQNNAFVNCAGYEGRDAGGNDVTASADNDLDDLDGQPFTTVACASGCGSSRVANNKMLAYALSSVFTDLDGADGDLDTIADNDYRVLPGADIFIRQGGLDSTANVCAPQGGTASCNVPAADFYGDPRSVPYSIGHDEVP